MPPKFSRGLDEQVLEGGVGGVGGAAAPYKASGKKAFDPDKDAMGTIAKAFGIPMAVSGVGIAADRLSKNKTPYDELPKKDEAEEKTSKKEKDVEGKKKGGVAKVKGWGIARGARKAKNY